MQRDEKMRHIRPDLGLIVDEEKLHGKFHHAVLRPILKLQNDALRGLLNAHPHYKKQCLNIDIENPLNYALMVEQLVVKNKELRNQLLGMILGLMSVEELSIYFRNQSAFNKRIISMLVKRLGER